ncbi:outer membrane protein assembly factor BamB family protein [Candidatus Pyrohabitans sp.]
MQETVEAPAAKKIEIIRITSDDYFEKWPSIDDNGRYIAFGRSEDGNFYDIVKRDLGTGKETVLFKAKSKDPRGSGFLIADEPVISGNGDYVAYRLEGTYFTHNMVGINGKVIKVEPVDLGYPGDCQIIQIGPLDVAYDGTVVALMGVTCDTPMVVNWGYLGKQAIDSFVALVSIENEGHAGLVYGPVLFPMDEGYEIQWGEGPRLEITTYRETGSAGEGNVAFPGRDKSGNLGLYVKFGDSGTIHEIGSKTFIRGAQMSRDGQRVFYTADLGTNYQLAYVDLGTMKVSEIISSFGKIFASATVGDIKTWYRYADPSGTKVVFATYRQRVLDGLHIINIDGTGEMRVLSPGENGAPNIVDWYGGKNMANGGSAIVFTGRNSYTGDPGDIYLIKLGGAMPVTTGGKSVESGASQKAASKRQTEEFTTPEQQEVPSEGVPQGRKLMGINYEECISPCVETGECAEGSGADEEWWYSHMREKQEIINSYWEGKATEEEAKLATIQQKLAYACYERAKKMRLEATWPEKPDPQEVLGEEYYKLYLSMVEPDLLKSSEKSGASTITGGMEGTLKWAYETGGYVRHRPAIGSDGTIYVGSEDGYLYAVNPDGTLKWKYKVGYSVETSPAVGSDGTIYFGGAEDVFIDNLYALNPDGTLKWKYNEEGFSISSGSSVAIGSDGTIYVTPLGNHLYALSPNGALKWRYEVEGDLPAIYGSPAIGSDGTIYFGASENTWNNVDYFYAVNPDGTLKWKHKTGTVSAPPAIGSDGTIYFGAWDHYFYALNPDGILKWRYDTGGHIGASPAIGSDGTIYIAVDVGTPYPILLALNPNGTLKWQSVGVLGSSSPAIGSDGTIYIPGSGGSFLALNPHNGTLKWDYTVTGVVFYTPTIGADGTIYTGGSDNYLYAIYGSQ